MELSSKMVSSTTEAAPWYRVLVGGALRETYVAERNLEEDAEGTPIVHPRLADFFDAYENGHYVRRRSLI